MEIFIIIVIATLIYLIIDYFNKRNNADKYTTIPINSWLDIVETKTDKEKESMAYSLIFQSANILHKLKLIQSINVIMNPFFDKRISKMNFVIQVISMNLITMNDEEMDEYKEYANSEARAFFATVMVNLIFKNDGSTPLDNFHRLLRNSQK